MENYLYIFFIIIIILMLRTTHIVREGLCLCKVIPGDERIRDRNAYKDRVRSCNYDVVNFSGVI